MLPIRVRPAGINDTAALTAFAARTFHATYHAFNTAENMAGYMAAAFTPERMRAEIVDPAGFVLLAESDEIVGYAAIAGPPAPAAVPYAGALEIKRFYVNGAWHGHGIAQTLMRAVIETARARGAPAVWLGVWNQNPRAIAFYRKSGFTDAGAHAFQLGDETQSDILMVRETVPELHLP